MKVAFNFNPFKRTDDEKKLQKLRDAQEQQQLVAMGKVLAGGAGLAIPVATAGHAAERLLGSQRILHGTGRKAGDSILREGLRPDLGGTGGSAAERASAFIASSKGHIHVAVPTDPMVGGAATARAYAHLVGGQEAGKAVNPIYAFMRAALPGGHPHGTVLAGALPYEKFMQDFAPDPDFLDAAQGAFRSRVPLGAKHLGPNTALGSARKMLEHRAPDLLGYIKRNPGRFAIGGALAAATLAAPLAGGALLKSVSTNVKKHQELGREANELRAKMSADTGHGLDLSKDDNSKKSRKGAIPRNVDTYLKEKKLAAFAEEMQKLSTAPEDEEEVQAAISKLQKPKPWKNIAQTAGMAAVAAPVIEGAGRFTKGFVDARGGLGARLRGGLGHAATGDLAAKGLRGMTSGDVVSRSLTAGLGGGVLSAAREGVELHQARAALHRYLHGGEKDAADMGVPAVPSAPAAPQIKLPAPASPLRGSSNKSQRVGNTPIAAKSGVTRSMSGTPMNPRASLSDAMTPKV